MPSCERCPEIEEDINSLATKYPSIKDDIDKLDVLLSASATYGLRCHEFDPDRVYNIGVHVAGLKDSRNRCSVIYELDGIFCHLWILYDNDVLQYKVVPLI